MKSDFSRVLANLRKEKGYSQREAAEKLEISQALLSHYEKGMREPGLAFVARVADYYNVSCDYLLGRSLDKQGVSISADQIHDPSFDKDNLVTGSILAMLNKKLVMNSMALIFDVAGKTKNNEFINEVAEYFYIPIYKVYRYLSQQSLTEETFNTKDEYFSILCDAEQKIREVRVASLANNDFLYSKTKSNKESIDLKYLTHDAITEQYPRYATSIFSVVQTVSESIATTTNPHAKTRQKNNK